MNAITAPLRPVTRADCIGGIRPCPWATCAHHLAHVHASVLRARHKTWTAADVVDVADMGETCMLDFIDRGDSTLEAVGVALGLTRERIRQIEAIAEVAFRKKAPHLLASLLGTDEGSSEGATDGIVQRMAESGSPAEGIVDYLQSIGRMDWDVARVRFLLRALGVREQPVANVAPKRRPRGPTTAETVSAVLKAADGWVKTPDIEVPQRRTAVLKALRALVKAGLVETRRHPERNTLAHRWVRKGEEQNV